MEELKKQCDYLFVLYHGGVEFFQYPTPWARQRFHRMADSGADVIIAQHTHCIGTEEYYGNAYLLYGQGNFCFHQLREKELANSGLLLQFVLSKDSIKILKYPIRNENGKVRLLPELPPDLEIRNRRLANGETFQEEFRKHAEKWMTIWMLEIRGHRLSDRILRKILGKERFLRYLRRYYKDYSVLRMLELVRAEEHSEIMQRGLADFYSMRGL